MKRRAFMALAGGAVAWPLAARARQTAMPVVGFVFSGTADYIRGFASAVRAGLAAAGFRDGENVAIEYRAAEGQYDRLPGLIADLVARKVAVLLAAGGTEPAKVARAKTATTPIVFLSAADPVAAGLVASLGRPGGTVTGISVLGGVLEGKRLETLHQLVPSGSVIAALVNPTYPEADAIQRKLADEAGRLDRQVRIEVASTATEIETAVTRAARQRAGGLLVTQDPFFASRREQLVSLAARQRLAAVYFQRRFVEIGGLASYSPDFAAAYRQAGTYVGRILAGARPAELPVVQSTTFELVVNLKTAKTLDIAVPPSLLAEADDVIE